jgi:hypothetical protein
MCIPSIAVDLVVVPAECRPAGKSRRSSNFFVAFTTRLAGSGSFIVTRDIAEIIGIPLREQREEKFPDQKMVIVLRRNRSSASSAFLVIYLHAM